MSLVVMEKRNERKVAYMGIFSSLLVVVRPEGVSV